MSLTPKLEGIALKIRTRRPLTSRERRTAKRHYRKMATSGMVGKPEKKK